MAMRNVLAAVVFAGALASPLLAVLPLETPLAANDGGAAATQAALEARLQRLLHDIDAEGAADDLYLTVLRDPDRSIAILVPWLTDDAGEPLPARQRLVAADAICYVPTSAAITRIAALSGGSSGEFDHLVRRCLNYAVGRGNPFSLAYSVLADSTEAVRADVTAWLRGLSLGKSEFEVWAAAIKARSGSEDVDVADLAHDPLVGLLDSGTPPPELLLAITRTP